MAIPDLTTKNSLGIKTLTRDSQRICDIEFTLIPFDVQLMEAGQVAIRQSGVVNLLSAPPEFSSNGVVSFIAKNISGEVNPILRMRKAAILDAVRRTHFRHCHPSGKAFFGATLNPVVAVKEDGNGTCSG